MSETDATPCYIARCAQCNGVFGIAVAPIERAAVLQNALKLRRQWERAGFVITVQRVDEARQMAAEFRHAAECPKYRSNPRRGRPAAPPEAE